MLKKLSGNNFSCVNIFQQQAKSTSNLHLLPPKTPPSKFVSIINYYKKL